MTEHRMPVRKATICTRCGRPRDHRQWMRSHTAHPDFCGVREGVGSLLALAECQALAIERLEVRVAELESRS